MSGVGVTESLTTTCPCCNGQVTVAAGQTELVPVPGLADNAGSTQSLERRVSLAEHAKRAGMSRLSFHGKDRRKSMGLVETPGPCHESA